MNIILIHTVLLFLLKGAYGDDCPCLGKDNSRLASFECPATRQCPSGTNAMQDYCGCGCQVCTKKVSQSCGGILSRAGTCSSGLVCANKRNNKQLDLKTKTVGICIEEANAIKPKKQKCGKSIVVKKQPSGVIYDYLRGNEKSCNYRFKGRRNQRVYASIKHVSFLGKQSKKCIPKFTLRDFSVKNKQSDAGIICTLSDVIEKGTFTSSSPKSQILFKGPSKKTGYIVIEFRFLDEGESVTVAPPTSTVTRAPAVESGNRCAAALKDQSYMYSEPSCDDDGNFKPLQCQEWGANLNEDRCTCVDPIDGTKTTSNRTPFCHSSELPKNQCSLEIEMTKRRVQESADPWALNGISYFPPKCDSKGNYLPLQCRESLYPFCRCVDRKWGNLTNTIAPDCDTPIQPSPTPMSAESEVDNRELRCPWFRCEILCRFGYNMDDDNCPLCTCKRAPAGEKTDIERCFAETDRVGREIVEMMNIGKYAIPFPEIPACDRDGNYVKRQCTQLHGCYCVDPATGRPSGFQNPDCLDYKPCVIKRVQSMAAILTNGNSVKSAKKLTKLLDKDMANNMLQISRLTTTGDKELLSQTYIEQCTQFGDYNGTQCDPNGGCWCVDVDGQNVVGNRRTGVPSSECYGDQRQNTQIPMIVNDLYDHWLDIDLSYPFYCTISHVKEEEDRHYYWTKDGVPINPNTHQRTATEVVYYSFLQQASMMLIISNVTKADDGVYRCEMTDSARNFHLSSTPVRFNILAYEDTHAQAPPLPVPCNMTGCESYCKYGYRLDTKNCPTCECKSFTEAEQMVVFYDMITERTNIFGSKGGRCQMERASALEVIHNANLSLSMESFYAPIRLHSPPTCDKDGNYQPVQCREYVGCFCVNIMTGEPSGRKAPECTKLRKCINQQIDSMMHIVGRLSDPKTSKKTAVQIKKEPTVSSIRSELFKVAMEKLPEKFANEDSDYPVPNCEGHGEYIPQICSLYLGECWCVDSYGDELAGTRVRTGEPLINCFQDFGVISGPSIQTPNNTLEAIEVSVRTGESATLPCRVASKTPDTYIQWSVRSVSMDVWSIVDERFSVVGDQVTDFSLRIDDAKGLDAGYYSCNVYSTSRQFRSYTSRRSAGVMLTVLV